MTTLTLLIAIAAAASTGLSSTPSTGYSTPIATGISSTLYAKAQNRPCLITPTVLRDSEMAVTMLRRSLPIRVTSEAAIATSVPLPIAMPRSACARAGASLMPSPTMATTLPRACSSAILSAF